MDLEGRNPFGKRVPEAGSLEFRIQKAAAAGEHEQRRLEDILSLEMDQEEELPAIEEQVEDENVSTDIYQFSVLKLILFTHMNVQPLWRKCIVMLVANISLATVVASIFQGELMAAFLAAFLYLTVLFPATLLITLPFTLNPRDFFGNGNSGGKYV